jgi:uncharacterized protein (TIGR03118 family)
MARFLIVCALCVGLSGQIAAAAGAVTSVSPGQAAPSSAQSVDPVVQWNKNLLAIVRTPGAQPATIHPTRSFAVMHAAIYDAVNAIDRAHRAYLVHLSGVRRDASQEAAAAAAAHEALVALYPTLASTLDAELQQSLAQIPDGQRKTEGIRIGQTVADRILALRSNDGSNASPLPYTFGNAPGDYQSTPPNFPPQPQFTHWSRVTPFALESADQFRPGPPPALTSDQYSEAFNEVKSLGIAGSTTATADEALTGRFWNGAIQNYWNEITQTASAAHHLTTAQNARLFALLNLSFADGVIAFYDAKYTYNLWRPVTAIRAADADDNPETDADSNWLPEVGKTAPDPSYPGAHAVISAAGAEVLISFFGRDHHEFNVTSEVLSGVERAFTSVSEAAEEATVSRVFAGQHFRFDLTSGQGLGREVADFVIDHVLGPDDHDKGDKPGDHDDKSGSYGQTNLVSDIPGLATHTDPNLHNPWGTSVGPGSPIWVSDNETGVTTLYDGAGNPQPAPGNSQLVVVIPAPPSAGAGAVGAPTGQAFNTFDPASSDFVISKAGASGPSFFLFATENGTIAGWNPDVDLTHAVLAVDRSTATDNTGDVGAVYKGLTLVTTSAGKSLYASNFRFGMVDVFDSRFNLVNSFTDPTVSAGFAPFGIHNIGGNLFVTFAKQDADKHDDVAHHGNGFVDVFAPNGDLLQRLVSRGMLDSPWAVTLAPPTFGIFGGDILVGNFGDGRINVYDPSSGDFLGRLSSSKGPITIPGLWGLRFAPATPGAGPNTLYFTAGINGEADGLFGAIIPNQ